MNINNFEDHISEIKETLQNLSKGELIDIVLNIVKNDYALKNRIILKYSKGNSKEQLEKCKKFIASAVREYSGRGGFISHRYTYDFVNAMKQILEKVRNTDDIMLALNMSILVLNEAVEAFQYNDDSGCLASDALDLIGKIVGQSDDLSDEIRTEVFNKLLELSDSNNFDGFVDYRVTVLNLCTKFDDIEILRYKLIDKIKYFIEKNKSNDCMQHTTESMLQILFKIIKESGTKKECEKFIRDNIKFAPFREMLINKYAKEKNYGEVIRLALEGEEKDAEYAGLVDRWKKIRYNIYKKLQRKEEQKKLAEELLWSGNFEYYRELKELNKENADVFYNDLKKKFKRDNNPYKMGIYLKIILKENDVDELMEFVRKNPETIEEYANKLVDKFSDEVIDIYCKHIKKRAGYSSSRNEYKDVCEILKKYEKVVGKKKQVQLINELSALYKRRTAFVDELSKIKIKK